MALLILLVPSLKYLFNFMLRNKDMLMIIAIVALFFLRAGIMFILTANYGNYVGMANIFYKFNQFELKHTTSKNAKTLKIWYNKISVLFWILLLLYLWYAVLTWLIQL